MLKFDAQNAVPTKLRGEKIRSSAAATAKKSFTLLPLNAARNSTLKDTSFNSKQLPTLPRHKEANGRSYFALLAFLAQASLQYFFLLSNVT